MIKHLANGLRAVTAALRPTPPRVYNVTVLVGIGLVAAGVDAALGRAHALVAAGSIVLAFAVFERLLLAFGSKAR